MQSVALADEVEPAVAVASGVAHPSADLAALRLVVGAGAFGTLEGHVALRVQSVGETNVSQGAGAANELGHVVFLSCSGVLGVLMPELSVMGDVSRTFRLEGNVRVGAEGKIN